MAVSWFYLLGAAIIVFVMALLYAGRAEWNAPLRWFMAWMGLTVAANLLMFLSRVVPDPSVSQSFWLAAYCAATALVLTGLFFVRSFEGGGDFLALFLALPACLAVSVILVEGSRFSRCEDGVWRFTFDNVAVFIPLAVLAAYSIASLACLVRLYRDVRRGGNAVARRGVALILWAFAVIFFSNIMTPYVREAVDPRIPLGEAGSTLGCLLIALDLSWVRARKEKERSFI